MKEDNVTAYKIERSTDGVNFTYNGTVNAKGINGAEIFYSYNDPVPVTAKTYYRLKIITPVVNAGNYSNVLSVSLTRNNNLEISNLVNPFQTKVSFQLNAFKNEQVELLLTDLLGHLLHTKKVNVSKGANAVAFEVPAYLQKGSYLLRIISASGSIHKIVQKQ